VDLIYLSVNILNHCLALVMYISSCIATNWIDPYNSRLGLHIWLYSCRSKSICAA